MLSTNTPKLQPSTGNTMADEK